MSTKEDERVDDDGPSVESNSQEERIGARRRRIQRRIDAAKRDALGEDLTLVKSFESAKELRKSRKQIEESYQRLVKLQSDGTELVSNVQVAVDARETARRFEDDENKRQRIEKLETEAKASIMKFEEITSKWKHSWAVDTPQQLYEVFLSQKAACDSMLGEKNKLIVDLQLDLKAKDDCYVKDLRRQAEDIDLMIDRMEEQVKTLLRAYREELLQIEGAFAIEREELINSQRKRRDTLEQQRKDKEVEYLETRENRVDDLNNQLQVLRTQDAEEYNIVKIKLETDVQILEQNLQQMKATYQLNQEKLEYNFQVLKKRDEENTITKSQQKRKITRLQDLLNNLKQKLKRQEKQYCDDNQSLVDDLRRITEQYNELQKKFRHFQTTDSKKFNDIWMMNQQQAAEVARDLMKEDKIIHEQQLGLPWKDPDLEIMKIKGPLQSLKVKQRSATEVAQEAIGSASEKTHGAASKTEGESKKELPAEVNQDTGQSEEQKDIGLSLNAVKQILDLLCNESGFLVESKLMKLLTPLDKEEQSLMKLDAIFNALGIDTEQDIHLLGRYFFETDQIEESEIMRKLADKSVTLEELKAMMIHPTNVFKALRCFVEENREPFRIARRQSLKPGITAVRDSSKDEAYWKQFAEVVAPQEERVWDALIDGFEKYSQVLTERATLLQETEALQTQNDELRLLLRQYMNSKVNQELEIPPTQVLQMEINR